MKFTLHVALFIASISQQTNKQTNKAISNKKKQVIIDNPKCDVVEIQLPN